MSQQLITKDDVSRAVKDLESRGHKPTRRSVRAVLKAGSMATIHEFVRELETPLDADIPTESLDAMRRFWLGARVGRTEQKDRVKQLEDELMASAIAEDTLQAQVAALHIEVTAEAKAREAIVLRESALRDELSTVREAAEISARKLVSVYEQYQASNKELTTELQEARTQAHRLELELAGVRAKLEVIENRNSQPIDSNRASTTEEVAKH